MVPKALPISHPSDAQPHETYGLSKVCCEEIASMLARCSRNATGFVSLRFTNIVRIVTLADTSIAVFFIRILLHNRLTAKRVMSAC